MPAVDADEIPILLEQLAKVRKCKLGPPATPAFLAAAEARLGAPLPAELRAMLAVSAEIHGGFEFDFDGRFEDLAPGRMFAIYDYGNGDGCYLEVRGDRCVGWWVGHDPWFLIRLDDSLAALLRRAIAEPKVSAKQLYKPRHRAWPRAVEDLLARETEPEARAFLASLPPECRVVDLRGAKPGTEIEERGSYYRSGDLVALDAPEPAREPLTKVPWFPRLEFDSPAWPRQPVAERGEPARIGELLAALPGKLRAPTKASVAAILDLVGPCAELEVLLEHTDKIKTPAAKLTLLPWLDDIGLGPMLRASAYDERIQGYWLLEIVGDRARVWFHARNDLVLVAGSLAEFLTRCGRPGELHRPVHAATLDVEAMAKLEGPAIAYDLRAPLASTSFRRPCGWALRREGESLIAAPGPDPALLCDAPLPAIVGLSEIVDITRPERRLTCRLPEGWGPEPFERWFTALRKADSKFELSHDAEAGEAGEALIVTHPSHALRVDPSRELSWTSESYAANAVASHLRYGRDQPEGEVAGLVQLLVALGMRYDVLPGLGEHGLAEILGRLGGPVPSEVREFMRAAGSVLSGAHVLFDLYFGRAPEHDRIQLGQTNYLISRVDSSMWWRTPTEVAHLREDFVAFLRRMIAHLVARRRAESGESIEIPALLEIEWSECEALPPLGQQRSLAPGQGLRVRVP